MDGKYRGAALDEPQRRDPGGAVEDARDREDLRVVAEPTPIEFDDGEFVAPTPHEVTAEGAAADD